MHHLSSAKLVRVVHLSRRPAHLPHRFRSALKSVRKHGSTVRRCWVQNWFKKNSLKHDASTTHAIVPSLGSMARSQINPIDSCQQSTLELHAQFNLTNDHKKKKSPYLQGCPVTCSCKTAAGSLLSCSKKDDCCRGFQLWESVEKKMNPRHSGQLFNQSTSTGENRKNGQQFTILKRITNSKV